MNTKTKQKFALYIPLVVLALLGIPRVILHDLQLVSLDSLLYRVLAIGSLLVWLVYALCTKSDRPFRHLLTFGVIFGLMLAVTHQITWVEAWGDSPPQLGGNLAGVLHPVLEGLVVRVGAFMSSLFTGVAIGAVLGGIAWLRAWLTNQRRIRS